MSKGLEALEKLGEMTLESEYGDEPKVKGLVLYETIEKELKEGEKNKEALEIIKVLFQGRCKLYERTEHIETCNEEGCHAEKIATMSYILEFHNYDLHYEFHLRKEEYDLLKEALL